MNKKTIIWASIGATAVIGLGLGLGLGLTLPNRDSDQQHTVIPEFPPEDKVFQDLMDTVTLEQTEENHFYEADDDEYPTQVIKGYTDAYFDDKNRVELTVTEDLIYEVWNDENGYFESYFTIDYTIDYWKFEPETINVVEDEIGDDEVFVNNVVYYSDYLDVVWEDYYNEFMYIQLTGVQTEDVYEFYYVDEYEKENKYIIVVNGSANFPPDMAQEVVTTFWLNHTEEVIDIISQSMN